MLRRSSLWLGAIAAVALSTGARAAEVAVDQHDLMFMPNTVTINAGDSVRFTDTDRIAHDVTIVNPDGTSVDHGMDYFDQDIVVKFDKAGAYQVRCRIHPDMKMTVTVK